MYLIEISSVLGTETWYTGSGWYWTDQNQNFNGPYDTEKEAVTDYAWFVHSMLEAVNAHRRHLNEPKILLPSR